MNNNYKVYDFMFEGENKISVVFKARNLHPMYALDDIASLYNIDADLIWWQLLAGEKRIGVGTLVSEEFKRMVTQIGLFNWIDVSASKHPISERFKAWIYKITAQAVEKFCSESDLAEPKEPMVTSEQITKLVKSQDFEVDYSSISERYLDLYPNGRTTIINSITIASMARILKGESSNPNNIYGDANILIAILQHDGFIYKDIVSGFYLPTADAINHGLMIDVYDVSLNVMFPMVTPDGLGYFLDHYIDRRVECAFAIPVNLELIASVNEMSPILEQYRITNANKMYTRAAMLNEKRKGVTNNE